MEFFFKSNLLVMKCKTQRHTRHSVLIRHQRMKCLATVFIRATTRDFVGKMALSLLTMSPPKATPESRVHGANMGPIWDRQDPGGPHVGPMNFVIWDGYLWRPSPCASIDFKYVKIEWSYPEITTIYISTTNLWHDLCSESSAAPSH